MIRYFVAIAGKTGTGAEQETARKRARHCFKLPSGKYRATVVLGYTCDENGVKHKKTASKVYALKKDAIAGLPTLKQAPRKKNAQAKREYTFRQLYETWLPTHNASKSTLDCYKAAFRYFSDIWEERIPDIDIDDLQECVDNCPHGKRTKQNMKAVCGLVYKYGIPRNAVPNNLNLAEFIRISGEEEAVHRESFSYAQIEQIRNACGKIPYADYIYSMIYLGFRPSEFLALRVEQYSREKQAIIGGAKTQAGTNRTVTISPKIQSIVAGAVGLRKEGFIFCDQAGGQWDLKAFTETCFYPALEAIGIDNPIVDIAGGVKRHKYTPHSCRHTFSTLMKVVQAPSKDKLELIGHTSEEMLRYYQDVNIDDLKKITDAI